MTQGRLGARAPHESAALHARGEARYTDDLPEPPGLLHGLVLPSPHAHAQILGIDTAAALEVAGVHAVLLASDLPGSNNVGPVVHDEPALAEGQVHCVGQPVAVVLAESLAAARAGLAAIEARYQVLPAVLGIDAALAGGSFHGTPHLIARGDVDAALESATHRLEGKLISGGQDHFYLETQVALAVPGEGATLDITCSTQHPSETQILVAEALGWGRHQVNVTCPRMGGAFGGKETQSAQFAIFAALGAMQTGRPVKCWLDRDSDMTLTGRRHPFQSTYRVGFDELGRIQALDADLVADGGWATDLSLSILDRALFHVDNGYWLPHVRLRGRVAKTNIVSNTAFRGFGGPQGMLLMEAILERVAAHLGAEPLAVRRANFYGEGQATPYGQPVTDFRLHRICDELQARSELDARRSSVLAFNRAHTWRKRAIALTPVKFGISFTASFLNQAGAYVLLYADGTAQLNHGGTEMGQGLHTKMIAVCAHALGIHPNAVRAMPTATDKVPNTSATAASSGADLNGAAIRNACAKLVQRLRPVAAELLGSRQIELAAEASGDRPDGAWAWGAAGQLSLAEVARAAHLRQIPMAAAGFYRTPDIHYDRAAGQGCPFHYFAYGAAVSEVELDGLTGQWRLLRADIVHDAGASLSPDIDVGQIEGGFIQGMGWLTMEELVFDDRGFLLTHSPSTYKIPAIGDAPDDLRVHLLERAEQPDVIYGSKAVGEPPFMHGISTWAALGRAVAAFGQDGAHHTLAVPATVEALAMAIQRAHGADGPAD